MVKKFLCTILALFICFSIVPATDLIIKADAAYENTHVNTGNQREDIVAVAKTQLGYTEGYNNDTKYGDWYGLPNRAWCAMFVSWCANQAGISTSIMPKISYVPNYFSNSAFTIKSSGYTPQPGDLFITKSRDHVGLVWYTEGSYFYSIEGNSGDCVCSHQYLISDYSFAVPNYDGPTPVTTTWDFSKPSTYPSYSGYLQVGSVDDDAKRVSFLQTSLNYLGFDCGNVDGQFGSATKEQVKNFQAAVGIEVDGIVGSETWTKLIHRVGLSDIGTDFWAYIILKKDWKHLENTASSNVQLAANGNDNDDPKQIWYVERTSEGRYKFKNAYDNKMLDLDNYVTTNGNNVQTWVSNSSKAQEWILAYSLDGEGYCIRTACGDTVLDSTGGATSAGTNIEIWQYNNTDAQKFVLYDLSTNSVNYAKPSAPSAPTLTVKAGSTTAFSWTESPLKSDKYDTRKYVLRVWKGNSASGDVFVRKDLPANTLSCNIDLADGTYTATVLAGNVKYSGLNASSNAVTFTVKSCTHSWEWVVDKAATCKATGLKHEECTSCKEKRNQNTVIPLASHTEVIDKAVAATCTSTGLTQGKHCSVCGLVIVKQETVAKLSHSYTSSITTQPTCTSEGVRTYKCSCGASYIENIAMLDHVDGNADGKCDNCDINMGTVTPSDPSKNCSCNCHKTGLAHFFFVIINFFQKLFGKNKVCACGVKH